MHVIGNIFACSIWFSFLWVVQLCIHETINSQFWYYSLKALWFFSSQCRSHGEVNYTLPGEHCFVYWFRPWWIPYDFMIQFGLQLHLVSSLCMLYVSCEWKLSMKHFNLSWNHPIVLATLILTHRFQQCALGFQHFVTAKSRIIIIYQFYQLTM